MKRLLATLPADERGTSAVEMGLVAPILALLTVGMIDLSEGFSEKLELEQVAHRSVERVMNGRISTGDFTAMSNSLKTEAAAQAGVAASAVTVTRFLECTTSGGATTTAASFTDPCPTGATTARYVSVSISKVYTPFFLSYKFHSRSANTYTLTGAAAVRIQ